LILVLVAVGFGAALVTLVWGRRRSARAERRLYVTILIVMQALYLGFVIVRPSARAFVVEAAFLLVCWGLAAGGRRWALLLPLGYLLHGLWDFRHGAQLTAYVPSGYPEVCAVYDWSLMLYFLTRVKAWSRS
jgi:hypothetical protein